MMRERTKHIFVKQVNRTMIVTPGDNLGELEFDELESEAQAIRDLYQQSDVKHLVVDLHNTELFGSSTLGWLLELRNVVLSRGGRMVLCGVSATVREVLDVTHLVDHWPVYASRDDALTAIGNPVHIALAAGPTKEDVSAVLLASDEKSSGMSA